MKLDITSPPKWRTGSGGPLDNGLRSRTHFVTQISFCRRSNRRRVSLSPPGPWEWRLRSRRFLPNCSCSRKAKTSARKSSDVELNNCDSGNGTRYDARTALSVAGEIWFELLPRRGACTRIACGFSQSCFCVSIVSRNVLVRTWKSDQGLRDVTCLTSARYRDEVIRTDLEEEPFGPWLNDIESPHVEQAVDSIEMGLQAAFLIQYST